MTWAWRYYRDDAGESCGGSKGFDTREAAEAWLSETWTKLDAAGIREVELVEGGSNEPAYRMSLTEG